MTASGERLRDSEATSDVESFNAQPTIRAEVEEARAPCWSCVRHESRLRALTQGDAAGHRAARRGIAEVRISSDHTGARVQRSPDAPPAFESPEQLVKAFDEGAAKVRAALKDDSRLRPRNEPWKLSLRGQAASSAATRFLAYRQMFLNHLVHHRAQLGDVPAVESINLCPRRTGPSADDRHGVLGRQANEQEAGIGRDADAVTPSRRAWRSQAIEASGRDPREIDEPHSRSWRPCSTYPCIRVNPCQCFDSG